MGTALGFLQDACCRLVAYRDEHFDTEFARAEQGHRRQSDATAAMDRHPVVGLDFAVSG